MTTQDSKKRLALTLAQTIYELVDQEEDPGYLMELAKLVKALLWILNETLHDPNLTIELDEFTALKAEGKTGNHEWAAEHAMKHREGVRQILAGLESRVR